MTKVAIIIPTMNRADFAVRLLNYYSSLNSPHAIYFADSSNAVQSQILKQKISELNGKLDVHYNYYPAGDTIKCFIELLKQVKEKYSCYMGDDDYFIPSTLIDCANFLENNPDFSTAIGLSLTFKIHGNGAYGKLKEIHDYPRHSITAQTASQRLFDYWGPAHTPLINCVSRTNELLSAFETSYPIKDMLFKGEYLPGSLLIISGKMRVLDGLGFVRQIHDGHYSVPDTFDWLTDSGWNESYKQFKNKCVDAIIKKDGLSRSGAEMSFKKAFWRFLSTFLSYFHKIFVNSFEPAKLIKAGFRSKLARRFPVLKSLYRSIYNFLGKKNALHYEVSKPSSPYYSDFSAILRSLINPVDTF